MRYSAIRDKRAAARFFCFRPEKRSTNFVAKSRNE